MYFVKKNLEKFNQINIFQVSEIFQGFGVGFGTAAFDTDTFQHANLYQTESHLILYPVI